MLTLAFGASFILIPFFLPCLQNESVLSATPVQIYQAERKCKNCLSYTDFWSDLGHRNISRHYLAHQYSRSTNEPIFPNFRGNLRSPAVTVQIPRTPRLHLHATVAARRSTCPPSSGRFLRPGSSPSGRKRAGRA